MPNKNMFLIITTILSILSCKKDVKPILVDKEKKSSIVIICQNLPSEFLLIGNKKVKVKKSFSYTSSKEPLKVNQINIKKNTDTIIIYGSDSLILHYSNLNNEYNYFAFPNDTLKISFNKKNIPYLTKNGNYNDFLLNFDARKNIKYPEDDISFFLRNKKFRNKNQTAVYLKEKLTMFDNEIKLIDSIREKGKNNEFKQRKNICSFKKYAFILNEENRLKVNNISFDFPKEIYDENFLQYKSYKWYLKSLIKNKYNLKLVKVGQGSIIDPKLAYNAVSSDNNIPEKIKEHLLYNCLSEIAENFSSKIFKEYRKDFSKRVTNDELVKNINRRFRKSDSLIKNTYFINTKNKQIDLEYIRNTHRGKVIYFDFWASWCAPCLKLMPDSKKLMDDFKHKDVVFIYISIDKDLDKWIQANEKEELGNENSFLAINYPEAKFYKELKLKSIPRYLIFDKQGKLIHKNAPSPNSKEIREIFNEYLLN